MSIETRNTVVYYTSAVCNLQCRYCFIDKNPALLQVDKILEENFKTDYFFEYTKKVFPDPNQLIRYETWGGEPYLHMDRLYNTLEKVINYYPSLKEGMSSTNFVCDDWFEQFFGLMNVYSKFTNREFRHILQLSLDGPEYITDAGRGKGTTKKFLSNFDLLMKQLPEKLPNNVKLEIAFKPTLDTGTLRILYDKEKIIEYYQFFEKMIEKVKNLKRNDISVNLPIPNTAVPSPDTREDGLFFADFCRLTRNIEKENIEKKYFKYYKIITLFSSRNDRIKSQIEKNTYYCCCGNCGTGTQVIGLLPNDMISGCHMAFVDLVSDYKKYSNEHRGGNTTIDFNMFTAETPTIMTLPYSELENYDKKMSMFYNGGSCKIATTSNLIRILALCKQVDPTLVNKKEALKAAIFIHAVCPFCIRDNLASSGSMTLFPIGTLRLFLNGAREYILNE